uniref:Uncharacterized protein n=1 Tax=Theropithecus gelada TaxID=9565 RepID=A0A8D2GE39_THEGE
MSPVVLLNNIRVFSRGSNLSLIKPLGLLTSWQETQRTEEHADLHHVYAVNKMDVLLDYWRGHITEDKAGTCYHYFNGLMIQRHWRYTDKKNRVLKGDTPSQINIRK